MEPLIEVQDLYHIYPGNVVALKGVNLQIYPGEIHAIIGQNGSGKTTLVKHFNGLLKPTKGKVVVLDHDTEKMSVPELSRYVGYVFQNPNHQLFSATVEKELAFGPLNLGLNPDQVSQRVEEAVNFFGLQDYLKENPLNMPFPLKKVVAIASVYTMKPRIIILDEPTTALDNYWKVKILEMAHRMNEEGHTVILVSHDMWLVTECAKNITVLWNGKILKTGPPKEVFQDDKVLEKTKLRPPQIAYLARRFGRKDILTVKEMAEFVYSAWKNRSA